MAGSIVTKEDLQNARLDLDTIAEVVNGSGVKVSRLGRQIRALGDTIEAIVAELNKILVAGGTIFPSIEAGREAAVDGQYYYTVSDDPDVSRELWQRISDSESAFITSDPSVELLRNLEIFTDEQLNIKQELVNALTTATRYNVYDFTNTRTLGLDVNRVEQVRPMLGSTVLSGGAEPATLLVQENGLTAVGQPLDSDGRQRLYTETPLIQNYPCTIVLSQRTLSGSARSVFWQYTRSENDGNIQITSNRIVSGGGISTFLSRLSVYIQGSVFPDGGSYVNVAWPVGQGNTLALVLRVPGEDSEVWVNGLKVATFEAPPGILQVPSYVMGHPIVSTAAGVEVGRCLVVDEALSGAALRQAGEWVARGVGGEWLSPEVTSDDVHTELTSVVIRLLPKSAVPFFGDAGRHAPVLYAKEPDLRLRPASTIKILTALVVADWIVDLDSIVTITEDDVAGGSGGLLVADDQISVVDLLYALIIISSNTAANALARYAGGVINAATDGVGGPWDRFVEEMNNKAALLGMRNSNITNPSGLSIGTLRLTADDLSKALIASVASPVVDELMRARHHTMNVSGNNVEITLSQDISDDVFDHMVHRKGGNLSGSWGSVSTYVATFLAPNGDLLAATAMWDGAPSGAAQGALYQVVMEVMDAVGWPRLLIPVNPRLIAPSVLAAPVANIVSGHDSSVFDFNQSGAYLTTTPAKAGDSAPLVASLTDSAVFTTVKDQFPPVIAATGDGSLVVQLNEGSRGYSSTSLINSLPCSVAFSMLPDPAVRSYPLFQSTSGAEGRFQLSVNAEYNGSIHATSPGKVQVFVGDASDGAGLDGQPLAGDYIIGQPVAGVIVMRPRGEVSEVWINGKLVDTFNMPENLYIGTTRLQRNTVVEGAQHSVSKMLITHQALTRDQVSAVGQWAAAGYGKEWKSPGYLNNDLLAAHGAIVYRDSDKPSFIGEYPENTILYEKGPTVQLLQASLTKVMTCMVMLDYVSDLDGTMTVLASDSTGGSGNNLNAGDVITYRDALYNMMLPSSNVTTTVVARTVGGIILDGEAGDPVAAFVDKMNAKSAKLNMTETVFLNASGLNRAGMVTCARDMGRMGIAALAYPDILSVWGAVTHDLQLEGPDARTVTINHSAKNMGDSDILGGKTGTLGSSARNLLEYVALPGGERAIAVVMLTGADTRYNDMSNLLANVRSLYRWPTEGE